jgi:hypothetical protein
MIKREGKYYVLYSKDGKRRLGKATTLKGIKDREKQIEYFKSQAEKKRVRR